MRVSENINLQFQLEMSLRNQQCFGTHTQEKADCAVLVGMKAFARSQGISPLAICALGKPVAVDFILPRLVFT